MSTSKQRLISVCGAVLLAACSSTSADGDGTAGEDAAGTADTGSSDESAGDTESGTDEASSDATDDRGTDDRGTDDTDDTDDTTETDDTDDTTDTPDDGILHVGTTEVYDADGEDVTVELPPGSVSGDLLVMFVHRTDDDLPLFIDGWTRVAECYKRDNGYDCSTEADCTEWEDPPDFCMTFGGNDGAEGHDLAQAVFHRTVADDEPSSFELDLNIDGQGGHPGWVILSTLRGADTVDPARDWAHTGCDQEDVSVFPSVDGMSGDMLMLSQSFDDAIAQDNFQAPVGTEAFGYVSDSDEAGFLFGGLLDADGPTGTMPTLGEGGPACKDALISVVIAPG